MNLSNCRTLVDKPDNCRNTSMAYVPEEFYSKVDALEMCNSYINFIKVQQLLDAYSAMYNVTINLILTGYDNTCNFKFETVEKIQIPSVHGYTHIIFNMREGVLEIVTMTTQ